MSNIAKTKRIKQIYSKKVLRQLITLNAAIPHSPVCESLVFKSHRQANITGYLQFYHYRVGSIIADH